MNDFLKSITKIKITDIIAFLIVILSFGFLYLLLFVKIPDNNKDITNVAIGFVLGSFVAGVSGFYFGASKKDEKPSNPIVPLIVFVLLIGMGTSSCNVTKHVVKSSSDSTAVTHKDSSVNNSQDIAKHEDKKSVDSGSISIDFYPEQDTGKGSVSINHNPHNDHEIYIHQTDSGITVINNTGNAIKSIKIKDSKSSDAIKDTSSKLVVIADKKEDSKIAVSKDAENIDKKSGVSIWLFIKLGVLVSVIGFIVWKCYSSGLNPWGLLLVAAKQVKRRLIG